MLAPPGATGKPAHRARQGVFSFEFCLISQRSAQQILL
jgi:hypothetical protein